MRVGVFDSGVGGLSILSAIRMAIPDLELAYCCDNLNFPYGTKSEADVIKYSSRVSQQFVACAEIDILVIACNTASTIALPTLRSLLPIPIVGVVPAVKPASQNTKSKIIGILATPASVRQPYLAGLISEFAEGCEVVLCGSSGLVQLAEQKMRGVLIGDAEVRAQIPEILEAASRGLDQLVLGCTHFPLLEAELRRVLPSHVQFVDSGDAVAKRVKTILENLGYLFKPNSRNVQGWCSGPDFSIRFSNGFIGKQPELVLQKLP